MVKNITVECQDCQGRGFLPRTEAFRGKRVDCGVNCHSCNGNGTVSFDFACCDQCGEPCCDCPDVIEEAPSSSPEPVADSVIWNGGIVNAPGFTTDTFIRSLERARARGSYNIRPLRNGALRVDTGRSGQVYIVSRHGCDCPAGQKHGYCQHRAACIWIHDICGIDLCRTTILGFSPTGDPVTEEQRARELGKVA